MKRAGGRTRHRQQGTGTTGEKRRERRGTSEKREEREEESVKPVCMCMYVCVYVSEMLLLTTNMLYVRRFLPPFPFSLLPSLFSLLHSSSLFLIPYSFSLLSSSPSSLFLLPSSFSLLLSVGPSSLRTFWRSWTWWGSGTRMCRTTSCKRHRERERDRDRDRDREREMR